MSNIRFSNPPLTEVVLGVLFNAPEFSSVHFGLYWEKIRERFPVLPVDKPSVSGEGLFFLSPLPPLRRVWFESADKRELVQLQSDRFYYNWRKQDGNDSYPQFEQIYPKFIREWTVFCEWWSENVGSLLLPMQYELTYINHIDKQYGWSSPTDHQAIFSFAGKDWSNSRGGLGAPESHIFALNFLLPDNSGNLSVSGNQGTSKLNGDSIMVLELTARSPDDNLELEKWFDLAHTYIVNSFSDLTQITIQKRWGRYE